jgi:hypothetical protein
MRASVGAFAIYMATISCCGTSVVLAKSTSSAANTKTRLRRRAQRNVIDVQMPEKNAASNIATKEDELALFNLETAQFASRFLQQSGSSGRRKRNRSSDDEASASSTEDESMEESTPAGGGNQNMADPKDPKDPAVIIAENLIPEANEKEEEKDDKDDKKGKEKEKDTTKIEDEPIDCSELSEDERADAIRKQLSEITDIAVLDNDMTAQGKAYDWITYFDNARLCPGGADKHLFNQRYILATLYFSTNGDNWFACFMSDPNCASTSVSVSDFNPSIGGAMGATSWLSGASAGSECSWHGIACNDDKYVQKVEIGKKYNVMNGIELNCIFIRMFLTPLLSKFRIFVAIPFKHQPTMVLLE